MYQPSDDGLSYPIIVRINASLAILYRRQSFARGLEKRLLYSPLRVAAHVELGLIETHTVWPCIVGCRVESCL